jgi:hypothetical protein
VTRLLLLAIPGVAAWAAGPYTGAETCSPCHRLLAARQRGSHHAQALRAIGGSVLAEVLTAQSVPDGALRYEARGGTIAVTARANGAEGAGVLEWAFGAGAQGITPVGRAGGAYFEHRYSYYPQAGRVAPTFGHPARASGPLALLGMPQSARTIASCFGCHATGVDESAGLADIGRVEMGVRCERCHGPGKQHAEAANAGTPTAGSIVNAGKFPAKAEVEFCGQCHRLPVAGAASPEPEIEDPVTVRFAPIGLMASRCFTESKRLRCTTCHDPHEDARPRTDLAYSRSCAGCHSSAPSAAAKCRRAAGENCLPCHMRQAVLSAYLKFTDHRIRVY